MKNKLLQLITIAIFLSFPFLISARSLDDIDFRFETSLEGICPSGKMALGCFNPNNQTISIRTDLNLVTLRFVITHEIGHFLMQNITLKEYQEVWGEGTLHELSERAANQFNTYIWLRHDYLTDKEVKFFNQFFK